MSWLRNFILLLLGGLVSVGNCLPQDTRTQACRFLQSQLLLENTTILSSTRVLALTNVTAIGTCQQEAFVSTAICRVEFVVNTTSTSAVHAEAWLPDVWYGRFLAVGNGGLGGCVDYRNLDYGASLNFATVASNNGHDGIDGQVFFHKAEVINDFAYRAIHIQTVVGKQIVDAYYGSPHHRSYYLGCSTGGRQGTQAALKYPDDFDGIVAGAPATDWNHLLGWAAMLARHVGTPHASTSPSFIPPSLWDVVAAEILKQCDALDGVEDGILTEPDACEFRPEVLVCSAQEPTEDCLSIPQVEALRKIYQPLYDTEGELIYPRYDPGTEADGNAQAAMSGSIVSYTNDWYRYTIFNNSSYDFSNFSVKDVILADQINPGGISTFDGDFSEFKSMGGKFLTYHGRRDELIPSGNSKRVYDLISKTLGMPSLDSFYRLFLIPGMNHCVDGPGASNFGQLGIPSNVVNASSHNVLLAMVDWVEGGIPPDTVVGTARDSTQRPHCRYPQRSLWNGKSFICQGSMMVFLDSSS
ncbi:hypothetical protein H0H87_002828 [Tephrocybe sp. NHM501043]|nr:hypothetical protein H0H87_002828 [Tephrocybe sp. NHM501043]